MTGAASSLHNEHVIIWSEISYSKTQTDRGNTKLHYERACCATLFSLLSLKEHSGGNKQNFNQSTCSGNVSDKPLEVRRLI